VKLALVRFIVRKEAVQEIGDFDRFAKPELARLPAILAENRSAGIFEDVIALG